MKARHIRNLRKQIHHYRMYRLFHHSSPDDIRSNELDLFRYDVIYGRDAFDAVKRYCAKRPSYYFHIQWLSRASWYGGDLMILEEGKPYNHRIYLDW